MKEMRLRSIDTVTALQRMNDPQVRLSMWR